MRLGSQTLWGRFGSVPPTINGGAIHPQAAGNDAGAFTLVQKFYAAAAPPFEFFRGSKRSAHAKLDAPNGQKDALEAQLSIDAWGRMFGWNIVTSDHKTVLMIISDSEDGRSQDGSDDDLYLEVIWSNNEITNPLINVRSAKHGKTTLPELR
jgi:hypothetical protein